MKNKKPLHLIREVTQFFILLLMLFYLYSCSKSKPESANEGNESQQQVSTSQNLNSKITEIENEDHFQKIIDQGGDKLLLFDLYADWCQPCKILSPILDEIAEEKSDIVSFYKVDVDKHKTIAKLLKARSIPFVVFIKNKTVVKSLVGVQAKTVYLEAISAHAE